MANETVFKGSIGELQVEVDSKGITTITDLRHEARAITMSERYLRSLLPLLQTALYEAAGQIGLRNPPASLE